MAGSRFGLGLFGARPMSDHNDNRFTELLRVRCPPTLPPVIERVAASQCMKPSEYIRRSVLDRLKADGIDIAHLAGAA